MTAVLISQMDLLEDLRRYIIAEAFHGQPPADFTDDYDLIETGVLDSLLMMTLITYASRQHAIEIGMNDLVPKNFHSVSALYQFLKTKFPSDQAA
jgi:acyl carrier protein